LAWTVNFEPRALGELKNLDRGAQKRVVKFLQERISREGGARQYGKILTGDKAGLWRYRIGDYRVVCRIDDDAQAILVLRVAHRKDIYR
jgi:mRNA interferase RelE/StbE